MSDPDPIPAPDLGEPDPVVVRGEFLNVYLRHVGYATFDQMRQAMRLEGILDWDASDQLVYDALNYLNAYLDPDEFVTTIPIGRFGTAYKIELTSNRV